MASFAARRPPRAAWGVEECARFAALKEFELLRLLSTDRKALATARRLGLFASHSQPHPPAAAVGGAAATAPSAAADESSAAPKVPNARQKRSAARSARHHAEMRAAQPPHPQSPTPAAPAEKVLAETATFAADPSAELDKDTEKVAPATGLIASFALRRASDHVPPLPHLHRPDPAAAIRACLGTPGFLPCSVGWVGSMAERLGL